MQSPGSRKLYPEDCTTCDTVLDLKNKYPAASVGFVPPVEQNLSTGGGGGTITGPVEVTGIAGAPVTVTSAVTTLEPRGADVPASGTFTFPPNESVATFTVKNRGTGNVTVDLGTGGSQIVPTGTTSWGDGDEATWIDIADVTITADASSPFSVAWESA